ncbi:MAG TPA: MOSC domain-containing protein [Bacillus bacterium]|nr:MOSC domain-containing protein [Bacillus sp. (in: firmicutes)]
MSQILYLNIGMPELHHWNGKTEQSAIKKKGVSEAFLTKEGFQGDGVAAAEFHGGPDRAVCFYPAEHYTQWTNEFGMPLHPPSFGENISADGLKEADVYIGDIYRFGNALIQVAQGRIPCSKISKNNEIEGLLKRVVETGFTGYFFRVLEEGKIYADSRISLLERSKDSFTILEANEVFFRRRSDYEAIQQLLEVKGLAMAWRVHLNNLMQKN